MPPTPAPLQWEGLCAPLSTRAGGPAASSQPCGKRVEPFFSEAEVQKYCLLPKLHSSYRSWNPICSLLSVLGKSLALSESHYHPASLCILLSPVLWVGQKRQGPGKTLGELGSSGHRTRRLLGTQLRAPPQASGRDPLRSAPGASSAAGARVKLPAAGTRRPTRRGARTQTPTLRGEGTGCSHSGAWGPGHLPGGACSRPHSYLHSPRAPRDSRAGTKSFMAGVLGRLRNEGSATCARSASL